MRTDSSNSATHLPKCRGFATLRRLFLVICAVFPSVGISGTQNSPTGSARGSDNVIVLRGGTLIDGTGANPQNDAVVVIRGNRIEAVGPRNKVAIPGGAQVLDTCKQVILPGWIESDFHVADWMPF